EADGALDPARRRDVLADRQRVAEVLDLGNAEALAQDPHQHRALREHRLADGEAGMGPFLEQEDAVPLLGENGGEHRATETGSQDGYIVPLLRTDGFHDHVPSRNCDW